MPKQKQGLVCPYCKNKIKAIFDHKHSMKTEVVWVGTEEQFEKYTRVVPKYEFQSFDKK